MKETDYVYPVQIGDAHYGLSARDYIAIQAMVGLSANTEQNGRSFEDIADMAYKQADAMIKRSEKDEQSV